MDGSELSAMVLGIAAWIGVAVFSVIAVANWDPLWGFFPVLAAVVAAWVIGEYVTAGSRLDGGGQ